MGDLLQLVDIVGGSTKLFLAELTWLTRAATKDATRSVCQVKRDGGTAVSTDGHRMHMVETTVIPEGFAMDARGCQIIIDAAKAIDAHRVAVDVGTGEVVVYGSGLGAGAVVRVTFPTAATFPDWRQVLPDTSINAWSARGKEMTAKDARQSFEVMSRGEKLDVCYFGLDTNRRAAYSVNYIDDALSGAGRGQVTILHPQAELDPVFIKYANRSALIMPVRV